MSDTVLCNLSDANEIIKETRAEWINDVFDALNIPDEVFEVNNINEYRMNMEDLGIEVILYVDGNVDVFKKVWYNDGFNEGWLPATKDHLVAQWKTPEKIMHVEPNGDLYYEIQFNEWSVANIGL